MSRPTEDMTDEQEVKAEAKARKTQADLVRERWRLVMAMPQAQDIVFDMLEEFSVFRLSYHPSGAQTAFNEGERSVALKIMDRWLDASPESFFTAMKRKKGLKNV